MEEYIELEALADRMADIEKMSQDPAKISPEPVIFESSVDAASKLGKFGWHEIEGVFIPYLTRSPTNVKLVSKRMAEVKLLKGLEEYFSSDLLSCMQIRMLPATLAEANLLNDINQNHSDNCYGDQIFKQTDPLIALSDLIEMIKFLKYCCFIFDKDSDIEKRPCGYMKIDLETVPYVLVDKKMYLPLFYFDGEIKPLEDKAVAISGWNFTYLKLLCKVQGVRREFFEGSSLKCIDLDYLKTFFAPATLFEETWPSENKLCMYVPMKSASPGLNAPIAVQNIKPPPKSSPKPDLSPTLPVNANAPSILSSMLKESSAPIVSQHNSYLSPSVNVTPTLNQNVTRANSYLPPLVNVTTTPTQNVTRMNSYFPPPVDTTPTPIQNVTWTNSYFPPPVDTTPTPIQNVTRTNSFLPSPVNAQPTPIQNVTRTHSFLPPPVNATPTPIQNVTRTNSFLPSPVSATPSLTQNVIRTNLYIPPPVYVTAASTQNVAMTDQNLRTSPNCIPTSASVLMNGLPPNHYQQVPNAYLPNVQSNNMSGNLTNYSNCVPTSNQNSNTLVHPYYNRTNTANYNGQTASMRAFPCYKERLPPVARHNNILQNSLLTNDKKLIDCLNNPQILADGVTVSVDQIARCYLKKSTHDLYRLLTNMKVTIYQPTEIQSKIMKYRNLREKFGMVYVPDLRQNLEVLKVLLE